MFWDCGGRNPVTIPPRIGKTGTTRNGTARAYDEHCRFPRPGQAVPRGRAPGLLTINPQKPFPVRVPDEPTHSNRGTKIPATLPFNTRLMRSNQNVSACLCASNAVWHINGPQTVTEKRFVAYTCPLVAWVCEKTCCGRVVVWDRGAGVVSIPSSAN